jgi:hypothetical protein
VLPLMRTGSYHVADWPRVDPRPKVYD